VAAKRTYYRSPSLVFHWHKSELLCTDCTSGRRFAVDPEVVSLLDRLDGRRLERGDVVRQLESARLISPDRPLQWPWSTWTPEAAFFHFGTRASRFQTNGALRDRELRAKAIDSPPPSPVKVIGGARRALPDALDLGSLSEVLRDRRTWRNFSKQRVTLEQLATVLQLTFGVQHWATVRGQGRVALKTSPSAGARHPIEAYVVSAGVIGLPAGVYHYDAGAHALVAIRRRRPQLVPLLAGQRYFSKAAFIVVMSAIFERSMWKYPSSRAYRSILIDAGHLGQTFCLVATALGLAPFCTMAFRESQIDKVIGVDGVSETAMYVVGAGSRPRRVRRQPGSIRGGRP
jgi:SagB-type dehydrogenase family enzyme